MRLVTCGAALLVFLLPGAGPAGNLRAEDSLKDEGFKVPRGVFSVPPGTFKPSQDFRPSPGDFKPTPGTFRPSQGFRPESGTFTVKPGTFKPPMTDFRLQGDFTVRSGAFYIGTGFLKPESVREEKPKADAKDDEK